MDCVKEQIRSAGNECVLEVFFRARCVERGTGEASGKSSGTESRMGEERKKCREEKLTVKVVWKNVQGRNKWNWKSG